MKKQLLFILIFVNASMFAFSATTAFDGGDGTIGNPYLISTATQLDDVRNNLSKSFKLTADIDLAAYIANNASSDIQTKGWIPIGATTPFFTGNFDGGGHFIYNIWLNRSSMNVGLFGQIGNSGACIIKNLGIKIAAGKTITAGSGYVGGIAGIVTGTSVSFSNCAVIGNIVSNTASSAAGGLVGIAFSNTSFVNCYAAGSVVATSTGTPVGGILSKFKGLATLAKLAGGITVQIDKCYAANSLSSANEAIAGFIGSVSVDNGDATTSSVLNVNITNSVAANPTIISPVNVKYRYRIIAGNQSTAPASFRIVYNTWSNNYAYDQMLVGADATTAAVITTGTDGDFNGLNKTLLQLQTQKTYTDMGWNFVSTDPYGWHMGTAGSGTLLPVLNVFTLKTPTAVNNIIDNNNSIIVFKNSNNEIVVNSPSEVVGKASVSVYNTAGQRLEQQEFTGSSTVLRKSLIAGVYIVNVMFNDKNTTQKVVIK